jgi:hypothetical protein
VAFEPPPKVALAPDTFGMAARHHRLTSGVARKPPPSLKEVAATSSHPLSCFLVFSFSFFFLKVFFKVLNFLRFYIFHISVFLGLIFF